ncbi:MAG: hypothetical protein IKU19_02935, partial [Clostridia bacterium]|nr:hypothetical protein [Clostridia bacterium]
NVCNFDGSAYLVLAEYDGDVLVDVEYYPVTDNSNVALADSSLNFNNKIMAYVVRDIQGDAAFNPLCDAVCLTEDNETKREVKLDAQNVIDIESFEAKQTEDSEYVEVTFSTVDTNARFLTVALFDKELQSDFNSALYFGQLEKTEDNTYSLRIKTSRWLEVTDQYSVKDRSLVLVVAGTGIPVKDTMETVCVINHVPTIEGVNNYTVTLNDIEDIKEIRFAIGTYTTGSEVKAAEQNVTLDAATVAKYTVDGVLTYDLPWVGEYTFWVRYNDGSEYFLHTTVENIKPYVTSYGVKLTVNDFGENYKDAWIVKGTYNTYSESKNATFRYQASATKLANYAKTTHDFTYTLTDPGDYTVLIRYNDGTFDVIHHTLTVTTPVLVENGLRAIITNIPDIKIIRTAYGHYESVTDIKAAPTVRYFNNKTAIKDAEEYMIQYREEGEVTIIVEYNDGYKHYFYYNVEKKVPTYTLEGDTITFGNLDDLYIIRYAPGKYTTSNNIKNAPNSQYKKAANINENGEIVITGLTTGRWSFMVQNNDDSYNFYVLDVE